MSSVFPNRQVGGIRTTIALCFAAEEEGRAGKPAVKYHNSVPAIGCVLPDNDGGAS
jgi:hypothetical protein